MEISIQQRGGVLGLDRTVEVKEGVVTVTEHGVRKDRRRLTPTLAQRLKELAARVLREGTEVHVYTGVPVSDQLRTRIEILDQGERRTLDLKSGDEAPDEVWELLGTVSEASEIEAG